MWPNILCRLAPGPKISAKPTFQWHRSWQQCPMGKSRNNGANPDISPASVTNLVCMYFSFHLRSLNHGKQYICSFPWRYSRDRLQKWPRESRHSPCGRRSGAKLYSCGDRSFCFLLYDSNNIWKQCCGEYTSACIHKWRRKFNLLSGGTRGTKHRRHFQFLENISNLDQQCHLIGVTPYSLSYSHTCMSPISYPKHDCKEEDIMSSPSLYHEYIRKRSTPTGGSCPLRDFYSSENVMPTTIAPTAVGLSRWWFTGYATAAMECRSIELGVKEIRPSRKREYYRELDTYLKSCGGVWRGGYGHQADPAGGEFYLCCQLGGLRSKRDRSDGDKTQAYSEGVSIWDPAGIRAGCNEGVQSLWNPRNKIKKRITWVLPKWSTIVIFHPNCIIQLLTTSALTQQGETYTIFAGSRCKQQIYNEKHPYPNSKSPRWVNFHARFEKVNYKSLRGAV